MTKYLLLRFSHALTLRDESPRGEVSLRSNSWDMRIYLPV